LPDRFDYILHAAGIASPQHYRANPLLTIDVTINVTRALLEKAKNDNSRMVFFSSSEIYGDPSPENVPTREDYRGNVSSRGPRACYDESKRLGETLCWIYENYYNTHVSVVRPFNVYGPGMMPTDFRVLPNFAASISKGEKLSVYGSGKQTRTFCYVTDAITGFLQVLVDAKNPDVFNVGNPEPEINMLDLVALVAKIKGENLSLELQGYPDSYPADEPNRRCPDITKLTDLVGYAPQVDLPDGLKRFLDWAAENY
jgi:UDP-glucuronate decarboxylase